MATRRPLYQTANGGVGEIADTDALPAALVPASGVPVTVVNGVTFAVPANSQVFARFMAVQASGEVQIPSDSELIFI